MVQVLPPDLSTTFVMSLLVPLILGLLVGLVLKAALKVGVAIAIIIFILIGLGIITPDQVVKPIVALFRSGSSLTIEAERISGYLPYSSITFLFGLVVAFWKS